MTSIPPSLVATCSPFHQQVEASDGEQGLWATDRKSTRLNSSHGYISYAVFCLKKKTRQTHSNFFAPFSAAALHTSRSPLLRLSLTQEVYSERIVLANTTPKIVVHAVHRLCRVV